MRTKCAVIKLPSLTSTMTFNCIRKISIDRLKIYSLTRLRHQTPENVDISNIKICLVTSVDNSIQIQKLRRLT